MNRGSFLVTDHDKGLNWFSCIINNQTVLSFDFQNRQTLTFSMRGKDEDREIFMKHIKDWIHENKFPYILELEKEYYTGVEEMEPVISIFKEFQKKFSYELYMGEVMPVFNFETHSLDVYYKKIDPTHKWMSITNHTKETFFSDIEAEKEKVEAFQNQFFDYMKMHPIQSSFPFSISKEFDEKELDWIYKITFVNKHKNKELGSELLQMLQKTYDTIRFKETFQQTLFIELEKMDPYFFTEYPSHEPHWNLIVFEEKHRMTFNENEDGMIITYMKEQVIIPAASYENREAFIPYIHTLLKQNKAIRLRKVVETKEGEGLDMLLRVCFDTSVPYSPYYDFRFEDKDLENQAVEELQQFFKTKLQKSRVWEHKTLRVIRTENFKFTMIKAENKMWIQKL